MYAYKSPMHIVNVVMHVVFSVILVKHEFQRLDLINNYRKIQSYLLFCELIIANRQPQNIPTPFTNNHFFITPTIFFIAPLFLLYICLYNNL